AQAVRCRHATPGRRRRADSGPPRVRTRRGGRALPPCSQCARFFQPGGTRSGRVPRARDRRATDGRRRPLRQAGKSRRVPGEGRDPRHLGALGGHAMRLGSRVASLVVFLLLAPGGARAGGPISVNAAGEPLVWPAGSVPYNPDQGTLGVLSNTAAVGLVESLFGVWDAVPTASVTTTDAGRLPVDVTVSNYPAFLTVCGDGLSPIIFD